MSKPRYCGLCDHIEDHDECGYANINGEWFCHTDSHSCYEQQQAADELTAETKRPDIYEQLELLSLSEHPIS